jgi:hypothetical protein
MKSFGGLAAGMTRPALAVDASRVTAASADALKRLVAAAAPHSKPPAGPTPDEMSYAVTIRDGDREQVLHQSDSTMTPQFAALLDFVRANGETQK